jgi:hypothetical protein
MARFLIIRGHLVEGARAAGDLRVAATGINNLADLALNRSRPSPENSPNSYRF